jgi:hypothetical protein
MKRLNEDTQMKYQAQQQLEARLPDVPSKLSEEDINKSTKGMKNCVT